MNRICLNGTFYDYCPVSPPRADTGDVGDGQRLILQHGDPGRVVVAPVGELTSGWVFGVQAQAIEVHEKSAEPCHVHLAAGERNRVDLVGVTQRLCSAGCPTTYSTFESAPPHEAKLLVLFADADEVHGDASNPQLSSLSRYISAHSAARLVFVVSDTSTAERVAFVRRLSAETNHLWIYNGGNGDGLVGLLVAVAKRLSQP